MAFFDDPNSEEDWKSGQIRQEAKLFEEKLRHGHSFFIDLYQLEDLFNFYYSEDALVKALNLLNFALVQYSDNLELLSKKILILQELNRYEEALSLVEEILKKHPDSQEYTSLKASLLTNFGKPQEALEALRSVLSQTSSVNAAELYNLMCDIAIENEDYPCAIQLFQEKLSKKLDIQDDIPEIAYCFQMAKQVTEGITFLNNYLSQNPFSEEAWYYLGVLQYENADYQESICCFNFAIDLKEDYPLAYFHKGNALMELERFHEALPVLLEGVYYDKDNLPILLSIGDCYKELQEFERARYYYSKCIQQSELIGDAWLGIAETLESEEKYHEAAYYYKKSTEIAPETSESWFGLAICESEIGNEYSAFEALKQALSLDLTNEYLWQAWAEKLHKEGATHRAISFLTEAIEFNSTSVKLLYQLAAYQFETYQRTNAFINLENALLLDYNQHSLLFYFCEQLQNDADIHSIIELYAS
ncbi:MAG: tetratricopeptide repeat protein [Bacteroidia bacterium]|nr:tetratricopeptide repeat protein [Bacteroidia bacterium]